MKILALLLSLSVLVFIHELGHYLFARLFKTRVEKFYLFFDFPLFFNNPTFALFRAKRVKGKWVLSWFSKKAPECYNEDETTTEWGIGYFPFGGYCSISGMVDETKSTDDMPSVAQPWEYRSKKAWQRLLIVTGGVLMNFIGALIIFSMMLFHWGKETLPIENVKMGYDYTEVALKNGFHNGDIIVSVNAHRVNNMSDVVEKLLLDGSSNCVIKRGDTLMRLNLPKDFAKQVIASNTPQFAAVRSPFVIKNFSIGSLAQKRGMQIGDSIVGINGIQTPAFSDFAKVIAGFKDKEITIDYYRANELKKVKIKLDGTAKIGAESKNPVEIYQTHKQEYGFFESIPAGIAQGTESLINYVKQFKYVFTKEGASQIGGFGAIGNMFPAQWNWQVFWNMTAFLSIVLAFMNILPIPALDGGYVMFTLWEMITRKKPSEKFLERANTIGMFLLFALLIYANGNDIFRWIMGKF